MTKTERKSYLPHRTVRRLKSDMAYTVHRNSNTNWTLKRCWIPNPFTSVPAQQLSDCCTLLLFNSPRHNNTKSKQNNKNNNRNLYYLSPRDFYSSGQSRNPGDSRHSQPLISETKHSFHGRILPCFLLLPLETKILELKRVGNTPHIPEFLFFCPHPSSLKYPLPSICLNQTLFSWAPNSLQMVTAAMKLKGSLEEKLWLT